MYITTAVMIFFPFDFSNFERNEKLEKGSFGDHSAFHKLYSNAEN